MRYIHKLYPSCSNILSYFIFRLFLFFIISSLFIIYQVYLCDHIYLCDNITDNISNNVDPEFNEAEHELLNRKDTIRRKIHWFLLGKTKYSSYQEFKNHWNSNDKLMTKIKQSIIKDLKNPKDILAKIKRKSSQDTARRLNDETQIMENIRNAKRAQNQERIHRMNKANLFRKK